MPTLVAEPESRRLPAAEPTLAELVGEVAGQLAALARQECALAKAEIRQTVSAAGAQLSTIIGGVTLMVAALMLIVVSAVAGLSLVLPLWAAALLMATFCLAVGVPAARLGLSRFKDELALEHLPDSLERNKEFIKEKLA